MRSRRAAIALGGALLLVLPTGAWAAFAGDGYEPIDFGAVDSAQALAVQGDRSIVAAGASSVGGDFDFALGRLTKGGALDGTFSGDAKQITPFSGFDGVEDVAIQKDGRIVPAGFDDLSKFALARYKANGNLDKTFSGDGKVTTGFAGGAEARAMAIQPNGRIVVVGEAGGNFALARFKENGKLDKSFSGDGKATLNFGGFDPASAVAIQLNGRVVVGGSSCVGGGLCVPDNFAIARFKENGKLDKSFAGNGKRTLNVSGGDNSDRIADLAIQDDNRIVAAGSAVPDHPSADSDLAVARFRKSGAVDKSFSGNGKAVSDLGGSESANAMVLQRSGRIVLAGSTDANGTTDIALAGYKPNGSLDNAFSGDGVQIQSLGSSTETAEDAAMLGRKKLVVAGLINPGNDFVVARFTKNGDLAD